MKKLRLLLPACAALLLSACAGMVGDKNADADALINASGIGAQLALLRAPLNADNLAHSGTPIPQDVGQALNAAIASSLQPETIRAGVKGQLTSTMNDGDIRTALAFFQSDSGQHIVAVESGKVGPGGGNNPDMLNDLDSATGTSRLISELAEQSISSTLDMASNGQCIDLGKLAMVSIFRGLVKNAAMSAVRQNVRSTVNTRYSTLSLTDVQAYLDFARSRPGQQYFAARNTAFGVAINGAGQALATALTTELAKTCPR